MKGFAISVVTLFLVVFLTVIFIRFYRGKHYLRVFLYLYLLGLLIYAGAYFFIPSNASFIPVSTPGESRWLDLGNGLLIYSFLFHCFIDVSFTTVITGFASTIMVHMARKKHLTVEEMYKIFGFDKSDNDPVIEYRLGFLLKGNYISQDGNEFRLLPKGRLVAKTASFFQRLFCIGETG